MFKKIFFVLLVMILVSCGQMEVPNSSTTVSMTNAEVDQILADYAYPENPKDYVNPLGSYGLKGVQTEVRQNYYWFYVTSYDVLDEEDFSNASQTTGWGNILRSWMVGDDTHWDTDITGMIATSYANVAACRSFLNTYAVFCTITPVSYSISPEDECLHEISGGIWINIGFPIETVPSGYVETDLNPDFEDWTSGDPDAWLKTIASPYNIPSAWNNYYAFANVTESTSEYYNGSSSARLYQNRSFSRDMPSYYFEIPVMLRTTGYYTASIWFKGEDQNVTMHFNMTLFDDSDAIIETLTGVLTDDDGDWRLNVIISSDLGINDIPKYVRFDIEQYSGQNTNYCYIDYLSFHAPNGDVSLPVFLADDIEVDLWGGGPECFVYWETSSEIENAGFSLFYENDEEEIVLAAPEFIPGQGNSASGHEYEEYFELNEDAMEVENVFVFIGAKSINGVWEYFPDHGATVWGTGQ